MTARQFKKWRELLTMTQDEIGTWLGVSRSTVNRWEGGTQSIPHMVGLLAARYRRPEDIKCDCVEFEAICDYHMGGRYRTDGERVVAWAREMPEPDDNSPTVTGVDTGGIIGEVHISSTEEPTTD